MLSDRQLTANRANARKSTGPRSSKGKKKAAANARRHGLAARFTPDAEDIQRIEEAVAELAGPAADEYVRASARVLVQAELELERVRLAKRSAFERLVGVAAADATFDPLAPSPVLSDLRLIERYAQRAYGRRDKAVCAFVRAQSDTISAVKNEDRGQWL